MKAASLADTEDQSKPVVPRAEEQRGTPEQHEHLDNAVKDELGKGNFVGAGTALVQKNNLPKINVNTEPEQGSTEASLVAPKEFNQGAKTPGMTQIKTPASSVEPSTSDVSGPIAERPTAGIPKIAAPQDMYQEKAGGALIPEGETSRDQRDFRNMERKAKVQQLEKQRQDALAQGDLPLRINWQLLRPS